MLASGGLSRKPPGAMSIDDVDDARYASTMHPLIPFFDRVTIEIGPLTLGGFGIMVVAGFLVGADIARRKLSRDGLDPGLITPLLGLLAIAVYVGGHVGDVLLYHPEVLDTEGRRFANMFGALAGGNLPTAEDVPKLLRVWEGLSSYGGFLAATLVVVWYFPHKGVPILPYGDAVIYGFATSWTLARIGCFLAHDHPGIQTNFWFGVRGICPDAYGNSNIACHDMGLYEAILSAGMALVLFVRARSALPPGYIIGLACVMYGPARFALDFLRHPEADARYAGLTPAQYGSLLLILVGVRLLRSRPRSIGVDECGQGRSVSPPPQPAPDR